MANKEKKQELPKWFKGELYSEGGVATNPYSGESIELTAVELSMYDFIWGSVMVGAEDHPDFRKALDWFIRNNGAAYMVLLD